MYNNGPEPNSATSNHAKQDSRLQCNATRLHRFSCLSIRHYIVVGHFIFIDPLNLLSQRQVEHPIRLNNSWDLTDALDHVSELWP